MMTSITLLIHNIRSTHNVGAIFRTAEGFGVAKIILSGYTPYPKLPGDMRLPHIAEKIDSQIHKTALGAEHLVPFEYYEVLDTWLCDNEENANIPVIGLEQTSDSVAIEKFEPADEFALMLGEEVKGIDAHYLSYCSDIVEIPMYGQKESFNVSVATGIALFSLVGASPSSDNGNPK